MLDSFLNDLALLQQSLPEGRRAKARELEERRQREEYLLREVRDWEELLLGTIPQDQS